MKMKWFVFILALLNCAATVIQACGFPPTLENGFINEGQKHEKNKYSDGDEVTYACHSGYISGKRIKSTCRDGKWDNLRGICRKKPCGSPGDTPNGNFHLEGEDFVYTAKVIYTCNEGYQMSSQMNYRICLADGWSNDIPHCEVLTCIPEKTDNNIEIISGMFQTGEPIPYANALRFQCNSEHLVLRGEEEIYCTANGTWSQPFPKCEEITCIPPNITHGSVHRQSKKSIYENNDVITFDCDHKYRPAERSRSTCTKRGWSPEPRCEEITCGISYILNGEVNTPKIKHLIYEETTLSCNEGYETVNKKVSEKVTCTETGEWSIPLLCKEITCVKPSNIPHGRIYSYKREYKINEVETLHCSNGYETANKKVSEKVTCTETGQWSIPLLCKEITCVKPSNIPYGSIYSYKHEYKINEAETLQCNNGYETVNKKVSEKVTCTETGQWSIPLLCKEITCVKPSNIPYGSIYSYKHEYKINEVETLQCNNGYETANKKVSEKVTCTETGQWSIPLLCKEITCVKPRNIPYGSIYSYKHEYKINEAETLQCNNGYETANKKVSEKVTCTETGQWSIPLLCKEITCVKPSKIPYGSIDSYKHEYKINEAETLQCNNGYETVNKKVSEKVTCTETGQWSISLLCKEITCVKPRNIPYGRIYSYKHKYKINEAETLQCNNGYETANKKVSEKVTCTETGQWSIPLLCKEITCVKPSNIPYGSMDSCKPEYKINEAETLRCSNGYETVNKKVSEKVTCTETGQWSIPLLCKEHKCQPPIISNGYLYPEYEYYTNGALLFYACGPEHKPIIGGTWWKVIKCVDGKWLGEAKCIDKSSCLPPPNIENASKKTEEKDVYINNATVEYLCHTAYKPANGNFAVCVNGTWELPSCTLHKKSCGTPPYVQYAVITNEEEKYYEEDTVTYVKKLRNPNLDLSTSNFRWNEKRRGRHLI
ncbi:complement factor H-like isoform X3 [Polyodon spathula]|uniref:complement factor H-like isoform X3 n=1 Tax=Polyodon spathula TaxID=7913 RepID=UPI001B7F725F|nr:complement factor H-like isoform X3 [Polyodon spathula]